MTALPKSEVRNLRPSIVIAEALVDRQEPAEIAVRAQELGFSRDLTEAVVHVCCRGTRSTTTSTTTTVTSVTVKSSIAAS